MEHSENSLLHFNSCSATAKIPWIFVPLTTNSEENPSLWCFYIIQASIDEIAEALKEIRVYDSYQDIYGSPVLWSYKANAGHTKEESTIYLSPANDTIHIILIPWAVYLPKANGKNSQ